MRALLVFLLAVHGAIHTLGFVKAFGFAEVAQLQRAISPRVGALWLLAAVLLAGAAAMLLLLPRYWWVPALAGVVLSQGLIFGAWSDARFGTLANLIILVPLAVTLLDFRPSSLRSTFERDVHAGMAQAAVASIITDADLDGLPAAVQTYLRRAGVVGKPRVRNFHAVFRADMRSTPDAPLMSARADQYEFFQPAARLFFMQASRGGVPFDVLHRYVGDAATMQVRIAGLVPIVDAGGAELTQSETVTLLNNMVLLAPATLVDAPIDWLVLDERRVHATFSNAGHRVSAVLVFDAAGDVVNFESDDRYQSDGKTRRRLHWSTPVGDYQDFGGIRLARTGETCWTEHGAEWAYGRFVLERISYNVGARLQIAVPETDASPRDRARRRARGEPQHATR